MLSEDNLVFKIPAYLRKNLELDLQATPDKLPHGLLQQVIFICYLLLSFIRVCSYVFLMVN